MLELEAEVSVITVERTVDYELIRGIVTHPKVYPYISDDASLPAGEWVPVEHDGIWYVLVRQDEAPRGVFVFTPQNAVCYEVHTCLNPALWGRYSGEAAQLALRYMFDHSPCRRVVTNVPAYNRLALKFARNNGLEQFGLNPQSYLKNGMLYDQHMLGISKEQLCH